ncbi:MAG: DUF5053 domain-containing protein [Tannerellaceae bacterium]|jgi:hypothetical protein|nr:DUF5053 domain-containing protein [Tannerellaceae bacterium]
MEDIRNLFPTEEMYNEFLLFQQMNDEERKNFANKNSIRFNSLSKEEQKKELADIKSGIEKTVEFTDEIILIEKLGHLPEYVSFSKIAKKYFGKTSGWLYHRLKGTLINGKPVKFTDEQKNKLADAFEELSKEFNKASAILRSVS